MGKKSKSHCCKCHSSKEHSRDRHKARDAILSRVDFNYDPYYPRIPLQARVLAPPNHNVYPYYPPPPMDIGFSTASYRPLDRTYVTNREVDGTHHFYDNRYNTIPARLPIRRYDENGREIPFD
ncbi:hypothetical protein TcWFU_004431 [Taenia crassiceps]|uniref:Uncharacterized protein n=1 Tax=Taenia crassiceps TaxID=6207 RepID=A0ABR4QKW1_9CEST